MLVLLVPWKASSEENGYVFGTLIDELQLLWNGIKMYDV
jgi:hypothetical protein